MSTTVYGCHNRAPIMTVCAPKCQYTLTVLGQKDARCHGCKERFPGMCVTQQPKPKEPQA